MDTLENTATITPALLTALAANLHAGAVLVQDATGTVRVLDYLNRFELDDPDLIVLVTRTRALALVDQLAQALTVELRDAGALL